METNVKHYFKPGHIYYNHENIVGHVEPLFIAKLYNNEIKYVVYKEVHTGAYGIIELSKWDEAIDMKKNNEFINEKPRFYTF